jgi:hypothetical protein
MQDYGGEIIKKIEKARPFMENVSPSAAVAHKKPFFSISKTPYNFIKNFRVFREIVQDKPPVRRGEGFLIKIYG